jgi:hypothetical protein
MAGRMRLRSSFPKPSSRLRVNPSVEPTPGVSIGAVPLARIAAASNSEPGIAPPPDELWGGGRSSQCGTNDMMVNGTAHSREMSGVFEPRSNFPSLGAAIELGEHEFPVPERLVGGQPAVGGTQDHPDQRVARLRDGHVAAQDAGHIDVDVLGHGAHGARIA